MINAIRADFYRLLHTKGFFITQIALILIIIVSVFTQALGSAGVMTEQLKHLQSGALDLKWDSYQTVIAMSTMAAYLIYFSLPLFVMILGYDLTKKTYKNQLAIGISRWYFFMSKYLIFLLISACQFIFYYGFTFLAAGIRYGFGTPPENFLGRSSPHDGDSIYYFSSYFRGCLITLDPDIFERISSHRCNCNFHGSWHHFGCSA
ncbi:hypothetical protein [Enterococcus durans]|uniref:hypothetical protein n=1 Tax=Enterococcus durans TaxID=53345 RepID=UPI000E5CDC87|nr:hypothetical protein [Enterococcus durans]RGW61932.1 hypothetical protein DWV63_13560 [Enterococcus durans]